MTAPLPTGPFGCILTDNPWRFETYDRKKSVPTQGADPYPTMTVEELAAIPVGSVAARDAVLFMWVIDSHLDAALGLGRAWGFEFKTVAFIWLKATYDGDQVGFFPAEPTYRMSMGLWTRKQAEICLLFTRGSPPRLDKGVRQIIVSKRREHSRKPAEQYPRIERLVGGPRLELFTRQRREGWAAWGNEVGKFDG